MVWFKERMAELQAFKMGLLQMRTVSAMIFINADLNDKMVKM